ncbi:hypothetical protein [Bosea sp. LjRoot237]|uniref:hypothetical protein n=1 Tax=Bosea sp. LjRoot237 TaxID=3342292 RepID=UPI003ED0DAAC
MTFKINDTPVILISETVLQSWARDVFMFATLTSLVAVGWFLESAAQQWVAALMGFLAICVRASGRTKAARMTIAEARKKLDELESAA